MLCVCCAGGSPVWPSRETLFADSSDDAFIGCKEGYLLPMMKSRGRCRIGMNSDQFSFPFLLLSFRPFQIWLRVLTICEAVLNVKYSNPFVRRKKENCLRQRFAEQRLKSNMIVGVSSSRNPSLVQLQHQPFLHHHHHHHHQLHQSSQMVTAAATTTTAAATAAAYPLHGRIRLLQRPIHQSTSPVILLHHPCHQQQHLRLHPHHHWSYMQQRNLDLRRKSGSPFGPCRIL